MRKLEVRSIICLALAAILIIGTGVFVFRFVNTEASGRHFTEIEAYMKTAFLKVEPSMTEMMSS